MQIFNCKIILDYLFFLLRPYASISAIDVGTIEPVFDLIKLSNSPMATNTGVLYSFDENFCTINSFL